jgi:hypothetical protein
LLHRIPGFVNANLNVVTKILSYKTYPEEKMANRKPIFTYLPRPWISLPIKTRLHTAREIMNHEDQSWLGIFFLGGFESLTSKCICRFDPSSPYYQAWFGIYMMIHSRDKECIGFDEYGYNIDELAAVGIGDQNSWLRSYHLQEPHVEITKAQELDPDDFHPEARVAFLGEMLTHSDFNIRGSNDWRYNHLFGKPRSSWTRMVDEHHEMVLRGYYVAWNWEDTLSTVIIYGCATAKAEKTDGTLIKNWDIMEKELKKMIRGIRFKLVV